MTSNVVQDRTSSSNIASPAFQSSKSYDVRQHDDGDLDLLTLSSVERAIFDAGYRSGYGHGIERGRELRMAEEEAAWSRMASFVRRMASLPTYSRLCELRGEPERAEAARAIERRLGVAS